MGNSHFSSLDTVRTAVRCAAAPWMLLPRHFGMGSRGVLLMTLLAFLLRPVGGLGAEDDIRLQLERLRKQNEEMQRQMQQQQAVIDQLGKVVADLQRTPPPAAPAVESTSPRREPTPDAPPTRGIASFARGISNVHISGEGGLVLFRNEAHGKFPNGAMRVDEAKLFLEAPVWNDVYFFTEMNLFRRQDPNDVMNIGEFYLDFENLSRWWNQEGQLNFRVGRLDIPFGEEYLTRDAIDSPLISHSLMDFWGVDEGVEFYGRFGKMQYVLAVQNGGHPSLNDYNPDKSVTLRLGYDPVSWLHLGASAMRTGNLDVQGDQLSELWFGDGFIRSLGSSNTTAFRANLVQGDAQLRWRGGHLGLSGGYLRYSDNDPDGDNHRNVYFYSIEAVQNLNKKLYLATRFSDIIAPGGFPLVGDGRMDEYFFEDLTKNLWRLSLGVGYRMSSNLLLKLEYSVNQGREPSGEKRIHENLLSAQVALKF